MVYFTIVIGRLPGGTNLNVLFPRWMGKVDGFQVPVRAFVLECNHSGTFQLDMVLSNEILIVQSRF